MIDLRDVSYFDFRCDEMGFDRKYLQFLHPSRLRKVLLAVQLKSKKELCSELNKLSTSNFPVTPSRIENELRKIRFQLYDLRNHAEIFGIHESIPRMPLDELKKIVCNYDEENKDDE